MFGFRRSLTQDLQTVLDTYTGLGFGGSLRESKGKVNKRDGERVGEMEGWKV